MFSLRHWKRLFNVNEFSGTTAYDRRSKIGHLDKALEEALNGGWTVVDMKQDWKAIYPFQLK